RADADEVLLCFPEVQTNLPGPDVSIDLSLNLTPVVLNNRERLVVAGHWLVARAGRALASLSTQPKACEVDEIERDLLWAGRIRAALVYQGLPATLQACEHWLGRPVQVLPRDFALRLLLEGLQTAWSVVESLEPRWSDRLESRCAVGMDRELSTRQPVSRARAAARHGPGDLLMPWPLHDLVAWSWLEPRTEWISRSTQLEPAARQLVVERWGLCGNRPASIAELAVLHDTTANSMQRQLHKLEVQLRMNRASLASG
ncbi:MAG: hypothetical protein VX527_07595, partial [Planctomycetota bacterium]|nr:hypothetical protein [Planctomycetota bacterium]